MITFRNTGTGNTIDFTQSNKVWSEVTYKTIRYLAASDFDNDGKQDMAVANGVNEKRSPFSEIKPTNYLTPPVQVWILHFDAQ